MTDDEHERVIDDLTAHVVQQCGSALDRAIMLVDDPQDRFDISLGSLIPAVSTSAVYLATLQGVDASKLDERGRSKYVREVLKTLLRDLQRPYPDAVR